MSKFKKQNFRLQRIYSDGSKEEPMVYGLEDIDVDWRMGRRGFLITSAIGIGALSGCIAPKSESISPEITALPEQSIVSKPTLEPTPEPTPESMVGGCDESIRAHTESVKAVSFSPDGKLLVSASDYGISEKGIKFWEMPSGEPLNPWIDDILDMQRGDINSVSFSQDGNLMASASNDKTINLWKTLSREYLKTLKGHTDYVNSVSFSPDGRFLASGSFDTTIKLWNLSSAELPKTLKGHTNAVNAVTFSPDGKLLASGSSDETIKLWEMPSGNLLKTLGRHTNAVNAVSFSPDGKLLASGSSDETIKLWEMPSGNLLKTLGRHTNAVNAVSFSPDGKLLASGSSDETVKLWEMPSGNLLKILEGHTNAVNAVSFSPDGKLLASGSSDETVKLWEMPSGKFLTCLFDPATLDKDKKAMKYKSEEGFVYTLPCGSPIPSGAICTCNCVPGTYVAPSDPSAPSYGDGYYCSCDKICTCIPIK